MKFRDLHEEDRCLARYALAGLPFCIAVFMSAWELREHFGVHPLPTSLVMALGYIGIALFGCLSVFLLAWRVSGSEACGAFLGIIALTPVISLLNAVFSSAWMEHPGLSSARFGIIAALSAASLAVFHLLRPFRTPVI